MNYNANAGGPRQPLGRKIKRVNDVNAMGFNPFQQPQSFPPEMQPPTAPALVPAASTMAFPEQPINYQPNEYSTSYEPPNNVYQNQMPAMNVFAQPMVQNMAMQYTQQLADQSSTMVKQQVERYVPVSKLKYYFAVDTKYVLSKLRLLFFPYMHKDWSIPFEKEGEQMQPRQSVNAPDLYIPTMGYVTYILVAGLILGMQNRFSPEQIGIHASSALAWCIIELIIYSLTMYIMNMLSNLRTLDLVAYSGYKFVGLIVSIIVSIVGGTTAYAVTLGYCNLSLAFFLVRSLKAQINAHGVQVQPGYYGADSQVSGKKRRLYFLVFVAVVQIILSWWLSFHLVWYTPPAPATVTK